MEGGILSWFGRNERASSRVLKQKQAGHTTRIKLPQSKEQQRSGRDLCNGTSGKAIMTFPVCSFAKHPSIHFKGFFVLVELLLHLLASLDGNGDGRTTGLAGQRVWRALDAVRFVVWDPI